MSYDPYKTHDALVSAAKDEANYRIVMQAAKTGDPAAIERATRDMSNEELQRVEKMLSR